jgi:hypothetical protein
VRDGIEVARQNKAVVALVTEQFWPQGDFVAKSNGMPDVPRLRLPHPVAGTGHDSMDVIAQKIAPDLVAILRGERTGDNAPIQA